MSCIKSVKGYQPPYLESGRVSPHIACARGSKGVYMVRKKGEEPLLYIGTSESQLYKTILRHFQSWKGRQKRTVYPKQGYEVKVILTNRKGQATRLEKALIIDKKPKDNPNKLEQYTVLDLSRAERLHLTEFNEEPLPF